MDKPSENRIKNLHPLVRKEVTQIVKECDEALTGRAKVRITQGLRTFKEQDELYAQGRTKAGKKVTNAKAGKTASWDTAKDWDNDGVADWYECVKIFAKHGWNWGGNWKTFKDLPHFERSFIWKGERKVKATWRNLQNLPKDKDGYVIFTK